MLKLSSSEQEKRELYQLVQFTRTLGNPSLREAAKKFLQGIKRGEGAIKEQNFFWRQKKVRIAIKLEGGGGLG